MFGGFGHFAVLVTLVFANQNALYISYILNTRVDRYISELLLAFQDHLSIKLIQVKPTIVMSKQAEFCLHTVVCLHFMVVMATSNLAGQGTVKY